MPPRKPRQDDVDSSSTSDFEDSVLSQLGEDTEEGDEDLAQDEEQDSSPEEEDTEEGEEGEEADDEGGEDEGDVEASPDLVNLKPDKKGNLIDPKTGKIVATAGPARRFYEDLTKTRQRLNATEATLSENRQLMQRASVMMSEMKAKVDAYEGAAGLHSQLGLTNDEHAEALQFMAKFKNPATAVDAIKLILTRAAQRGINMEGLQNSPLDLNTLTSDITKRIEEQISPLTNHLKVSNEQAQQEQRVRTEVNNFLTQNPQAREYMPVIIKMAQRPELANLTLNESWLLLQNYLLRQRQEPEANSPPSRPGGRRSAGQRGTNRPDDSPVTVDASYRDIVKSVVKDHGGLDFS